MPQSSELVFAENVRIDDPTPRGKNVVVEGLTFASNGPHLVIVGGSSWLGAAMSGVLPISRGVLRIGERAARDALAHGEVIHAPLDPVVPESWSPRIFSEWTARLTGAKKSAARDSADRALKQLELGAFSDRPFSSLPLAVKRATTLAAALASQAKTIVLDDPTAGLPDDAARPMMRIAAKALDSVSWIFLTHRISMISPFGLRADDAIVIHAGSVITQGALAEIAAHDTLFSLQIAGESAAFCDLVLKAGAKVDGNDTHLQIELPESMNTSDLFAMAETANATIVSLKRVDLSSFDSRREGQVAG